MTKELSCVRAKDFPARIIRGAADGPVFARQWYECPNPDAAIESWCYSDGLSYQPGDQVMIHAISHAPQLCVLLVADRPGNPILWRQQGLACQWAATPADASVTGCGWPLLCQFIIGADWPSGACRLIIAPQALAATPPDILLEKATHRQDGVSEHLIIIRPARGGCRGRLVQITADGSWMAYNDWGGSNHYEGIIDPGSNRFSPVVSSRRPLAKGFVSLPADAPRTLPEQRPAWGAETRYPHMDWAWEKGFSKKYASAGWASYDRHFFRWALENGYDPVVITQRDLHYQPDILDGAAMVVMVGHDEYWSWEMRDAIDRYRDHGGLIARFAGNFLWQIRLEEAGARQICYKYAAGEDPYCQGPTPHLTTAAWEAAIVGRPGHASFGLDATRGMYAGWGGLAVRGAGGFTLYRPDHWIFAGTGLGYGDVIGQEARVFGYEVDGLAYRIEAGLPSPAPTPGLPEGLEILAIGLARLDERPAAGQTEAAGTLFVADDDARFIARLRYGNEAAANIAEVDRGSGMIVAFPASNGGYVTHIGTTEWVAGLWRNDAMVTALTRRILDQYQRWYQARQPHP